MNYISLCSGIEAASEAFIPLGFRPIAFSEIEPFPCAVLKHRYPDVPNHGDLSKYDWGGYRGKANMVCAGFPCQAFSIAGLRNSLEDSRGNLSIIGIKAILAIRPEWVLLEQVPGVLSAPGNAFGCILAGLSGADDPLVPGTEDGKWRGAGIVSGPGYGLAWRALNAEFFGVPQRRERIFIVGYLGDWRRAAQVLFEPHGLPGYSAESCQEGQAVTGEASGGLGADSKPLAFKIRQGKSGGGKGYLGSEDKAFTVATGNDQTICIQGSVIGRSDTAGPAGPEYKTDGKSFTVDTKSLHALVLYENHGQDSRIKEVDTSPQINANAGTGGGQSAFGVIRPPEPGRGNPNERQGIHGRNTGKIMENNSIRRLLPEETEALQGFPKGYTRIPVKKVKMERMRSPKVKDEGKYEIINGEIWQMAADGPRYKSIGNSWAVPCARWIGERILKVEAEIQEAKK